MNADSIQYALETDWPVGAAGFEPLHLEIRSAEVHPASTGSRRRSGALAIRDAQVRVPPPGLRVWVNSDSEMQRFESSRPSRLDCRAFVSLMPGVPIARNLGVSRDELF